MGAFCYYILLSILNIVKHCLHVWTEERSGELSCCFVFIWARRGWRLRLSGGDIHLIPLPQWRLQNNVQIIKDKGWIVIPATPALPRSSPHPAAGTWPGPAIISTICLHPTPSRRTHLHIYISIYLHIYISTYLSAKCCLIDVVELNLLSNTSTNKYTIRSIVCGAS